MMGDQHRQRLREAALDHPNGIARETQPGGIATTRKPLALILPIATGILLLSGAPLLRESAAAPAGNEPTQTRKAPQHVALPQAAVSPFVGEYAGKVEGGSGSMRIQPRAGGRVHVDIIIGSPDCSGSLAFEGTPKNGVVRYRGPSDQITGHQCNMTLTRRGNRITTAEDGCLDDHGQSCSFSGTFKPGRF